MVSRIFGAVPEGQTSLYNELDYIVEGQGSNWYEPYVWELKDKGVNNILTSEQEVDEIITRQEALMLLSEMIYRVEEVEELDLSEFKDVDNVNIKVASVVDGFPDRTLRLGKNLSRIEAITMLVNTLEKLGW